MGSKNVAVFGIYHDKLAAERAVEEIKNRGFRNTDVSFLFSDNNSSKKFAHEKNTKAPEGTAVGVSTGAVIGGTLGWLAGIGALAIPLVGPLIAAGPIVGLLAGVGIGGTVGGITGALVGMGIPEYEAKRFEGIVKNGGVLLSVHCDTSEWITKAKKVLEETGAKDISSAGEAKSDQTVDPYSRPARNENRPMGNSL